jgi:hypothetical protein
VHLLKADSPCQHSITNGNEEVTLDIPKRVNDHFLCPFRFASLRRLTNSCSSATVRYSSARHTGSRVSRSPLSFSVVSRSTSNSPVTCSSWCAKTVAGTAHPPSALPRPALCSSSSSRCSNGRHKYESCSTRGGRTWTGRYSVSVPSPGFCSRTHQRTQRAGSLSDPSPVSASPQSEAAAALASKNLPWHFPIATV